MAYDIRVGNNFLGNGGTEVNPTTGWFDLAFRNYDPAIGRMLQIDPLATQYASNSAYHYAGNNPVTLNDLNGAAYNSDPMGGQGGPDDDGGGKNSHDRDEEISDLIDQRWNSTPDNAIGIWSQDGGGAHYYANDGNGGYAEVWGVGSTFDGSEGGSGHIIKNDDGTYTLTYSTVTFRANSKAPDAIRISEVHETVIGTQEGDPLTNFLKANFSADYEANLDKISWAIDTKEEFTKYNEAEGTCVCGITKGYYDSKAGTKVQVYINPFAFSVQSYAYLIIGHEFVHAKDRSDGTRLQWNADYGNTMGYNLSEYYAYQWQFLTAQSLGYPYYGAIEGFNKYKALVKDVIKK